MYVFCALGMPVCFDRRCVFEQRVGVFASQLSNSKCGRTCFWRVYLTHVFSFVSSFFSSFSWQLRKLEAKEEAKRKAAEKEAKAKIPANEYFRGLQVTTFKGSGIVL